MQLTSFYTALTGLNNNSVAINVIGDNLANMNTTSFKSGKACFAELLAGISGTSATGNPISVGLGSTLNGITHNNSQGTIVNTGNVTNAAINGNGFFVVSNNGEMAYTRSGAFTFDKDGKLLSSDGFQAMGYMGVNGTINTSGAISPIVISQGQLIPANATTNISLTANLNGSAEDGTAFSAPVTVYDSMGAAHNVTITFTKETGAGEWSWSATIPAEDTGGAVGDPPTEIGPTGSTLTFDGGVLPATTTNPTLTIAGLTNGAADISITFNLMDSSGNPVITNYSGESSVSKTTQDGYAASALSNVSIDNSGVITGLTENGKSIALAQLVLANFPNVDGLQKYKGSTFVAFSSSGEPSIGVGGTGGRGSVIGSSLEQSNVDMAQEFINLIVAQRAYQANSRVITTTDELYQDSLNLKR
jgi:flagellar hook protein FlgE